MEGGSDHHAMADASAFNMSQFSTRFTIAQPRGVLHLESLAGGGCPRQCFPAHTTLLRLGCSDSRNLAEEDSLLCERPKGVEPAFGGPPPSSETMSHSVRTVGHCHKSESISAVVAHPGITPL